MNAARKPTSRRWSWKRTVALIVFALLAAVAVLVAVPALVPEAVLRREVEAALSAQLGRPVTIDGATFRWSRGLRATGVRVGRGGEEGETPLATIRSLAIRFDPLDAAPSLAGGDLPLESVRLEGLELWLVLDRQGRTNVQDLAERKPLEVHSIQVTDARIHVENRRLGRSVTVENLDASVGQLAGSGHGYVSVSAELAGERPGRFVVTANLDRLEFGGEKPPIASLKADWTDLAWPALCAMVTDDADLAARLGRTSGHMTVNFDRGGWSAEGAVEAAGLTLGPCGPLGRATIAEAILGFQVRQKAAEAPLEILLARFSAPGIDLRVFRRTSKPDEPPPHLRLVKAPDGKWTIKEADLHATGTVTWVPLCQSIPALNDLARQFEQMGGKARVVLDVEPAGGSHAVTASADLTDTLMIREGTIHKGEHQTLRLKVKAACAGDFGSVRASQVELVTETARLNVEGDLPLPIAVATAAPPAAPEASPSPAARGTEAPAPAAWLAGARFSAVAHVESVETLLEMVPALSGPLGTVKATGPLTWELFCSPLGAADLPAGSPPTWDVKVRGDLTKTRVAAADGVRKDADRPATFALQARIAPGARRVDVGRAAVTLDRGTVEWNGSAQVEWPSEEGARPAGRFDGTLAVTRVESLGAVVSPASFAKGAPVSGNVRFDVLADLADGRLRTRLKTSLADLGIDAADWFAKPAGRPASLTLDALWQSGARDHVEASAEVEVPGARFRALGRSEVQVRFVGLTEAAPEAAAAPAAPPPEAAPPDGDAPAEAEAAPAPPKWGALHVQLVPTSTLELRAAVTDLARAAEVSPALARNLRRWGAAGAADATVLLAMGRRAIEATANVDLTAAAIDFSPYLRKPAGQAMRIDLAADAPPPTGQSLRLHLAKVEARLGDSVARAEDGWARLSLRGLTSGLSGTAMLTAVLEEADVRVRADVNHDAALGAALPWLEPLYARCRLAGPTQLTLAYSGTPLRGRVQLDADATACRISPGQPAEGGAGAVAPGAAAAGGAAGPAGETVIKAAGTPATVRLELRYGEVPGEMVIDRLSTTLADATAETQGRMLFDDPRLTVLAPPTAWSFEVHGRMPDAAVLASLLPARLADLKPTGGVTLDLVAAADPKAAQLESCQLRFDKAGITWLGKPIQLDGPVTYDHHRLATDGLRLVAGGSDVNVVAYIADPKRDPTGSVFITGPLLDIKEALAWVQETSAYVASLTGGEGGKAAAGPAGRALSEMVALRAQQLLAGARLSVEINLDRVTLAVPQWNTTYDLLGLQAEGRLAERRFVMPRFGCSLNEGTIGGEMVLDFRPDVPLLSYAYDAVDLHIKENLTPFIDATFPGMKAFGTLTTRARMTQPLAAGSVPVGGGETILTDGLLEGPGAPEYMQAVLPGLRLTKYPFNRMSNTSENKPNGDVVNHMLFDGKAYDIYIFGVTHPDGYTDYTLGVDLSVSLGEKVVSLPLEQGKLPLMRYTGRIVGSQFAERQISYVLPHEFAYDVFIRKNLLLRVIRGLGEKEPEIKRPLVAPPEKNRTRREG